MYCNLITLIALNARTVTAALIASPLRFAQRDAAHNIVSAKNDYRVQRFCLDFYFSSVFVFLSFFHKFHIEYFSLNRLNKHKTDHRFINFLLLFFFSFIFKRHARKSRQLICDASVIYLLCIIGSKYARKKT